MTLVNEDRKGTAYAVTVDARDVQRHRHLGRGPGAHHPGARRLGDRAVRADPARARRAAARRCRAGCCGGPATPRPPSTWPGSPGCTPAGALCEMVNDDGSMMRAPRVPGVRRRARPDDDLDRRPDRLPAPSRAAGRAGRRGTALPTEYGEFTARRLPPAVDGTEHVALVHGDIGDGEDVLVRVHSECLTGDVFGSLRCDCGPQLQAALRRRRRGGPRRRALHARARGPRHRAGAQAAGLPAAGRRRRHRRRQPRARPARRRPRLRHRRADPRPTSGVRSHAAADQQPGQARRASRATGWP